MKMMTAFLIFLSIGGCSNQNDDAHICTNMNKNFSSYKGIAMVVASNNYYKEIINGEILIGKKKYVIDPDDRYKQNKFLYKIANKENNRYYLTAVNIVSDGEFMQFKGSDKRCYFVIKKIYRADALTNEEDISAAHRLFYKSEPIPKI